MDIFKEACLLRPLHQDIQAESYRTNKMLDWVKDYQISQTRQISTQYTELRRVKPEAGKAKTMTIDDDTVEPQQPP